VNGKRAREPARVCIVRERAATWAGELILASGQIGAGAEVVVAIGVLPSSSA
jgi:hypothetical protein